MALNATELQSPDWLNNGDNAWQLTVSVIYTIRNVNVADSFKAATVVGLQSVPGLMVIYGGLVKTKWAINSAFMVFYAFAAVMVCWGVWAYQMSFGEHMIPGLVGIPRPILSSMSELKQVCEYDTYGCGFCLNISPRVPFQRLLLLLTCQCRPSCTFNLYLPPLLLF